MGMTKEQFMRKMFGDKQRKKNQWLKKQNSVNNDADCFAVEVALKIRKKNYGF